MINKALSSIFAELSATVQCTLDNLVEEMQLGYEILSNALNNGKKILLCGNGGSAAESQHIATEFVVRFKKERVALPAIALTVDSSILTAIPNDYEFTQIFARQIKALGQEGDILIALTTSGNSDNILCAIDTALAKGMKVIVLSGKTGGKLSRYPLCNEQILQLIVPYTQETARIQEIHLLILHAWCEMYDDFMV